MPNYPTSILAFCGRTGLGKTTVYAEIAAGRLIAHKIGARTLIFPEDEAAWKANLPRFGPDTKTPPKAALAARQRHAAQP